jgi:hypothetical protein
MSKELLAYGRPQSEWDELEDACLEFLLEIAPYRMTTYTELNAVVVQRTGLTAFDFSQAADRAAMGHLLGLVVDRTFPESGLLISALVKYMYENGPGPGFYGIASDDEHRLLPKTATAMERLDFWAVHVGKVQEHYRTAR